MKFQLQRIEGGVITNASANSKRVIDVPPAEIYAVLADYNIHHPQIMPASLFSDLVVEEVGVGAGTVFRITLSVAGKQQVLHMRVAEPEPGQVLTETNLDSGSVTMFRVTPTNDGASTMAEITTNWDTGKNPLGMLDKLFTPHLMRRIFAQQLKNLEQYTSRLRRMT